MRLSITALRETWGPYGRTLAVVSGACWIAVFCMTLFGTRDDLCKTPQLSTAALAYAWIARDAISALPLFGAMITAMMALVLGRPIYHLATRSRRGRRVRAVVLFLSGYYVVWTVALLFIVVVINLVKEVVDGAALGAFAITAGVALIWHSTSVRYRNLVSCDALPALRVFGLAAEVCSLRFGVARGVACVSTCGPLMAIPFVSGQAHLAVMVIVYIISLAEQYARPRYIRWRGVFRCLGIALIGATVAVT